MTIAASSPEEYLSKVPEERKVAMSLLRQTILDNLPEGFEETINYAMIGYVVPHRIFPDGYHCDPTLPLPFMNIASQKNFIAFYHMGLYIEPKLLSWLVNEYPKHTSAKPDMGKSCVRFKKPEHIPFELIGKLVKQMSINDWIELYKKQRPPAKKK